METDILLALAVAAGAVMKQALDIWHERTAGKREAEARREEREHDLMVRREEAAEEAARNRAARFDAALAEVHEAAIEAVQISAAIRNTTAPGPLAEAARAIARVGGTAARAARSAPENLSHLLASLADSSRKAAASVVTDRRLDQSMHDEWWSEYGEVADWSARLGADQGR